MTANIVQKISAEDFRKINFILFWGLFPVYWKLNHSIVSQNNWTERIFKKKAESKLVVEEKIDSFILSSSSSIKTWWVHESLDLLKQSLDWPLPGKLSFCDFFAHWSLLAKMFSPVPNLVNILYITVFHTWLFFQAAPKRMDFCR